MYILSNRNCEWKIVTARLEMAGQEDEGVMILEKARKKNSDLEKSHHVYEIDMLLAELLIYVVSFSLYNYILFNYN